MALAQKQTLSCTDRVESPQTHPHTQAHYPQHVRRKYRGDTASSMDDAGKARQLHADIQAGPLSHHAAEASSNE